MQSYWLYSLALDGRIERVRPLQCRDDEDAVKTAGACVGDGELELWSGRRLVERFQEGRPN